MIEIKDSHFDGTKKRIVIRHMIVDASDGDETAQQLFDLLMKVVTGVEVVAVFGSTPDEYRAAVKGGMQCTPIAR